MQVTVAICTWNRCELLRQTLEQLVCVDVPADVDLDVLVINNNCTDATDAVVGEFMQRLPIRCIFEPTAGLSNARNAALAAASGDYVIFTDDDVLLDESWLVEFDAAARAFPEATAIGGIIEPWFPVVPDPELVEAFPAWAGGFSGLDYKREPGPLPDGLCLWGANMAFKRARLGTLGFNPDLGFSPTSSVGSEEFDFQQRLRREGGDVIWWPKMKLRHYVSPSRLTSSYLLKYTAGKGAEFVLTNAVTPAPSWFGAPRWLWLLTFKALIASFRQAVMVSPGTSAPSTYSGPPPGPRAQRRARSLVYRRELAFLRGMIQGYRKAGKRQLATPNAR